MPKCDVLKKVAVISLITLIASGLQALGATPSAEPTVEKKNSGKTSGKSRDHKKGKSRREKDAEGTKAQNRFEPEINAKSPYKFGGHELEVDTD